MSFTEPNFKGCAFIRAGAESTPGDVVEAAAEEYRKWVRALFVDLATQAGATHPAALAQQLTVLYDGAGISAWMDHDRASPRLPLHRPDVGRRRYPTHTNAPGEAGQPAKNPRQSVDGVVDLRHDDRRDVSELYTSSRGGIAERLRLVQAHDADLLVDIMNACEELLTVEQGHLDRHSSLLSETQILDDSRHRESLAPTRRRRP
jgi:hypothetical protein